MRDLIHTEDGLATWVRGGGFVNYTKMAQLADSAKYDCLVFIVAGNPLVCLSPSICTYIARLTICLKLLRVFFVRHARTHCGSLGCEKAYFYTCGLQSREWVCAPIGILYRSYLFAPGRSSDVKRLRLIRQATER